MAQHTQIVSHTPKRTRIRVSRKRQTPKEMARLAEALEASPKVSKVETNLTAGTIIVHHEEKALPDIKARLQDLGVILMAATGVETSSKSLADAVSELDSWTKGILNLKLLVPLGFAALAVLQIARRGLEIGGAPWYLLAYFAFESFTKLNSPEIKCTPAESAADQSAEAAV